MKHPRFLLFALFLVGLVASAASAQGPVRTFVASTGSDANPCSRTAPCRTFQAAVDAAAPGGEVVALDSAGFGSNVSITKSISIIGSPGVGYAGITVFSGDGVDINAGSQDIIVLRGITVINQGSNGEGVRFNTGGTLHIESCVVNGFGASVVFLGTGQLEVKDSIVRSPNNGIFIDPGLLGGTAFATVDQVRIELSGAGGIALSTHNGSTVTVRNTLAVGGGAGFTCFTNNSLPAELDIENCVATRNSVWGVSAGSSSTGVATVRISNSTVTKCGIGLNNLSGSGPSLLLSRGNNTVEGNTTNTSGTIGSYTAK